jgi:4-amino-4-deoxy-L-arabinose transferase-like glycosyltransferase
MRVDVGLWVGRALRGAYASRWGLVLFAVSYALFLWMFSTGPYARNAGSDGFYTWLYARSIVYDHDIDFTNDYALCGDNQGKNVLRGTSHPDNPFYIGPSVTWVPVLAGLRLVIPIPPDAPEPERLACYGPLTANTLGVGPLLGALAIWLMYRVARRHADDGPAALAAGLLGLCTTLPAYAAMVASYSHVHDTFWAAVTMITAVRASERPRAVGRWALAGVAVGVGLLQRPVSVLFGLVPAVLAIAALRREPRRLALALAALGAAAVVFGAVPQMLVYKYLYGTFWAGAPHGRFYMQYGHAHPWLVLFAPHGGLLFTAPVAWLALPGAIAGVRARKTRVYVLALVAACAAVTWISAAPIDWHGSGTFGARRLTSLLPLLAPMVAIAVARGHRWLRARPSRATTALAVALLAPVAFSILGASYGLGRDVSTEEGTSQAGLYGAGDRVSWGVLDDRVGDLSILPAELVFHLRYGLRMNAFRDATEPLYDRNYRTMQWGNHEIDLTHDAHGNLTTDFRSEDDGRHMTGTRATFVFAAQWPYATQMLVRLLANPATAVHIGRGTPLGVRWYGTRLAEPTETTFALPIPEGGFDSGILEIVFQRADVTGDVRVSWIDFQDATVYPAPL